MDFETSLISFVWKRPRQDDSALGVYLAELDEEAQRRSLPSILLGDWNGTPEKNEFVPFLNGEICGVKEEGLFVPSRFKGRCVDYAIAAGQSILSSPAYGHVKLSGKMVTFQLRLPGFFEPAWKTAWRPRYECPPNVAPDVWRTALRDQWLH